MTEIGIYYYPWYNKTQWGQHIAKHTPAIGFYDSTDPVLVRHHVELLKHLGIDYIVIETLPVDDWNFAFSFAATEQLIKALRDVGIRFSLMLDFAVGETRQDFPARLAKLLDRIERHGFVPTKLRNGLPQLLFFGALAHGAYFAREQLKNRYSVFCADYHKDWNITIGNYNRFVADRNMHQYIIPLDFLRSVDIYVTESDPVHKFYDALPFFQFWCPTQDILCMKGFCGIIPGYDDILLDRNPQIAPMVPRHEGQTLVDQFSTAVASGAEEILIYGWNEYFEATEIEPTLEHGDFYFELTRRLIAQVKSNEQIHMPCHMGKPEPWQILYLSEELERSAQRHADKLPRWDHDDYLADVRFEGTPVIEDNHLIFQAVQVKNIGNKNWPVVSESVPIRLGGQLLDARGMVVREGRAEFSGDMPPNAEAILECGIELTGLPGGEYTARLGVVWEDEFWLMYWDHADPSMTARIRFDPLLANGFQIMDISKTTMLHLQSGWTRADASFLEPAVTSGTAEFAFEHMPDIGRMCLTLCPSHPVEVTVHQNGILLRRCRLAVEWNTLYFDVERRNGSRFSLCARNLSPDSSDTAELAVAGIECTAFQNNRFYLDVSPGTQQLPVYQGKRPFISAYYYLWYFTPSSFREQKPGGGKWSEGYLRSQLDPPQYPTLGEYVMNDPNVIEAHIDWAADHGIDCFICNWEGMEGHRKFLSENLVHILQGSEEEGTLSPGKIPYSRRDSTGNGWDAISMGWNGKGFTVRNLNRIQFSALIESRLLLKDWPPVAADPAVREAFKNAILYFAENFFCSPRWQRIDSRPVLYFYEVFSWKGSSEEFESFRANLDDAIQALDDPLTGEKYKGMYIIADVVYPYSQDMDRLKVFDAVTGYQPYPPTTTKVIEDGLQGWNFQGTELFTCPAFKDYHHTFQKWGAQHGIPLIPTVICRYNDRGVRGTVDHYAYPPASRFPFTDIQDIHDAKLFIANMRNQMRWADPDIPMLNINSWNEWFEDTAIEPVGFFPDGPYPDFHNQGDNVGTSTRKGFNRNIPDKIVVYGENGHQWIDTPPEIKERGTDVAEGYEWPCYGFDYLSAIKRLFGVRQ